MKWSVNAPPAHDASPRDGRGTVTGRRKTAKRQKLPKVSEMIHPGRPDRTINPAGRNRPPIGRPPETRDDNSRRDWTGPLY